MKEWSIFAVPLILLISYLAYHLLGLELIFDQPFIALLFSPTHYPMLLTGTMSLLLSLLAVIELRNPERLAPSRDPPIDSQRLDEMEADIEELQEAMADLRAMTNVKAKKAGE